MQTFVLTALRLLIPVLSLLIPVLGIIAFFIVPPLTKALAERGTTQQPDSAPLADPRVAELEREVAELKGSLQRVMEGQESAGKLRGDPSQ